jgi:hypothetical protein
MRALHHGDDRYVDEANLRKFLHVSLLVIIILDVYHTFPPALSALHPEILNTKINHRIHV